MPEGAAPVSARRAAAAGDRAGIHDGVAAHGEPQADATASTVAATGVRATAGAASATGASRDAAGVRERIPGAGEIHADAAVSTPATIRETGVDQAAAGTVSTAATRSRADGAAVRAGPAPGADGTIAARAATATAAGLIEINGIAAGAAIAAAQGAAIGKGCAAEAVSIRPSGTAIAAIAGAVGRRDAACSADAALPAPGATTTAAAVRLLEARFRRLAVLSLIALAARATQFMAAGVTTRPTISPGHGRSDGDEGRRDEEDACDTGPGSTRGRLAQRDGEKAHGSSARKRAAVLPQFAGYQIQPCLYRQTARPLPIPKAIFRLCSRLSRWKHRADGLSARKLPDARRPEPPPPFFGPDGYSPPRHARFRRDVSIDLGPSPPGRAPCSSPAVQQPDPALGRRRNLQTPAQTQRWIRPGGHLSPPGHTRMSG